MSVIFGAELFGLWKYYQIQHIMPGQNFHNLRQDIFLKYF